MTNVDFDYSSSELPTTTNCTTTGSCSMNNIDNRRNIYASRYVKRINFYLSAFDLESSYNDYLDISTPGTGIAYHLTGTEPPGPRTILASYSFQKNPVSFFYHTDNTINSKGFTFSSASPNRAQVCCSTVETTALIPDTPLLPGERVSGLLLGDQDIVSFWSPVGSSDKVRNIALWAAPGRDFDIYVRCNALPTQTVWDYHGISADPNEFLTWNEPGPCSYPGTLYMTVHAYTGSGQFSIMQSQSWKARRQETRRVRVAMNFNATAGQLQTVSNTMQTAGRIFYGMTEGQTLIERFYLFNNWGNGNSSDCNQMCGGKPCQICFKQAGSGCGGWEPQCGYSDMGSSPIGMAHELGHLILRLPDEKLSAGSLATCGHSMMGNFNSGTLFNLCTTNNHGKDPAPGVAGATGTDNWSTIFPYHTPQAHTGTPDNHNFTDHDFNGQIDVRMMP